MITQEPLPKNNSKILAILSPIFPAKPRIDNMKNMAIKIKTTPQILLRVSGERFKEGILDLFFWLFFLFLAIYS